MHGVSSTRAAVIGALGMRSGQGSASMALEILHRALVLLRRRARLERAEITPAASLGVGFARIEPVAPGLELADHRRLLRTANALRMQRMLAPRRAARRCALTSIAAPGSIG